jgi:hypothetical protein
MRLQPLGRRLSALLAAATVIIATAQSGPASAKATDTRRPVTAERPASSEIEVYFYNQYKNTVRVAVADWAPNVCKYYGRFLALGWWSVKQGEKVHVVNTDNQIIMYYAESEGMIWAGNGTYRSWVAQGSPWSNCWTVEQVSPWREVNFIKLNMGNVDEFTLYLTP